MRSPYQKPILASSFTGAPPQVTGGAPALAAPQAAPNANPYDSVNNNAAAYLQQLLAKEQAASAQPQQLATGGAQAQSPLNSYGFPAGGPDPQADMSQGFPIFDSDTYRQQPAQYGAGQIPQITPEMFQNPNYNPQRDADLQHFQEMLFNEAVGGGYDKNSGQLNMRGKIQKYGEAAGGLLSGLGGIAAAFGPDGAAEGMNKYLELSRKNAEDKRKADSDKRKNAIEGMAKLADVLSKSRQQTPDDIENILKAHKYEADKAEIAAKQKEVEQRTEKLRREADAQPISNVKDIMSAIASGTSGVKNAATAGAQDALASKRGAETSLVQSKTTTEGTKADLNKAKTTETAAKAKLADVRSKGVEAGTKLTEAKTSNQPKVGAYLDQKTAALAAKTKAAADPKTIDSHFFKALNTNKLDGAAVDPQVRAVRDQMVKDGNWNKAGAEWLVNNLRANPKYAKTKGSGLTQVKTKSHG